MKDPATIKRSLNICLQGAKCENCAYKDDGCTEALATDTVEYIWRLEEGRGER